MGLPRIWVHELILKKIDAVLGFLLLQENTMTKREVGEERVIRFAF